MRTRANAFTLVEVLVVIGIVAALTAIVSSVITSGKHRAKVAVDISNLRQIGLARSLYEEQAGGPVFRTAPLVQSGLLSTQLLRSQLDPSKLGIANHVRRCNISTRRGGAKGYADPEPGYFDSYYPVAAEDSEALSKKLQDTPGAGWLVSFEEGRTKFPPNPGDPECPYFALDGTFQRLNFDGSVVTRSQRWTKQPMGGDADSWSLPHIYWFSDVEVTFP